MFNVELFCKLLCVIFILVYYVVVFFYRLCLSDTPVRLSSFVITKEHLIQ